jgi:hypothetical protein
MTLLTTISNEAVNDNLQKRWTNGEIYTYIGAVLISVNPFRGQRSRRDLDARLPKAYRYVGGHILYHSITQWVLS